MAQCKQTAQEFIQDSFSPTVAVLCSHDTDLVCKKNNLSFVELTQPFCRLNTEDVPDDKSKSPATETGMDARTDSIVRKRYSVKQKAALLDKNSNETPSGEGSKTLPKEKTPEKDLPQRSLSAGSSSSKKISEDDKKASDTKDKADGDSQSSKDMQLNGSTKSTETKEIYL